MPFYISRLLSALSRGAGLPRLPSATLPCIRTGRPALCAIRRCANVAEPKPEPGGMQGLADIIGDRNAKILMQTGGVTSRLADGSLLSGIRRLRDEFGITGDGQVKFWGKGSVAARLEDEAFWAGLTRLGKHGISGDWLVTFMSDSVAARLDDEAFWAGLTRLGEHGISGDGLITFMSGSVAARLDDEAFWAGLTRLDEFGISGSELVTFMSTSVAARLDNDDFMDGLSSLCSELSPLVTVKLLKNNASLASRLTPAYARSILSITRHLDYHGFEGAKRLKTLIGVSPLVGKVPELEEILLAADTPDKIKAKLQMYRGSRAQKRTARTAV
jgi:hypothetical protein